MKKIIVLIVLIFTISIFALDNVYNEKNISFSSNNDVSVNKSIKLKIYQWIFAKAEGVNEITFSKPGKQDYVKLMEFVVGSNDVLKYNIKLNSNSDIIKKVWLWEVLDDDTTKYLKSSNGKYLEGFSLDAPIIKINNTLKFKKFRIGADFDIKYDTKPQDETIEVILTLVPKVKF